MTYGYGAYYEDDELGSQTLTDGLSLEEAFQIAAQEAADAFFANGGDDYGATDISYVVEPSPVNYHISSEEVGESYNSFWVYEVGQEVSTVGIQCGCEVVRHYCLRGGQNELFRQHLNQYSPDAVCKAWFEMRQEEESGDVE